MFENRVFMTHNPHVHHVDLIRFMSCIYVITSYITCNGSIRTLQDFILIFLKTNFGPSDLWKAQELASCIIIESTSNPSLCCIIIPKTKHWFGIMLREGYTEIMISHLLCLCETHKLMKLKMFPRKLPISDHTGYVMGFPSDNSTESVIHSYKKI